MLFCNALYVIGDVRQASPSCQELAQQVSARHVGKKRMRTITVYDEGDKLSEPAQLNINITNQPREPTNH